MDKKISDIKDLSITECLVDNCINDSGGNFWNNFSELNVDDVKSNGYSVYYNSKYPDKRSLPDPDACSERLYEFHGVLWEKQRKQTEFLNLNIPQIVICQKSIWFKLNNKNIALGSDSIMNIYWHRTSGNMPEIMKKISQTKSNYKEFIKEYLKKANTIGGFVLFTRHNNSINQQRGKRPIDDRFDLTLECIRRAYQYRDFYREDNNPLFGLSEEDKKFFRMFGSFENYAKFFCLNKSYDGKHNWVTEDCSAVYDLMSENGEKTLLKEGWPEKILPCDYTSEEEKVAKWWIFYRNIMNRLDARNEQIKEVIEGK